MINDKKAPRCRPKAKLTLEDDFFKYLFEKEPVLRYKYSKQQIKDIVKLYNKVSAETIVDNRYGVELPILNKQIVMMAFNNEGYEKPNYDAYYNNGQNCKELNQHTGGYQLHIKCISIAGKQKPSHSEYYSFAPHRLLRLNCSSAFSKNWNMYIRTEEEIVKKIDIIDTKEDLSDYNEFEI